MSTWGEWNPNVSTMDWQGGFVQGSTGVMNTRAGQHHKMKLAEVQPGRFFALETSVIPGTTFRFNCRVDPLPGGKTKIGQAEAQALADVRAAAADAAVAAAEKILRDTAKGKVADDLIAQGIADVKAKLN